MKIVIHKHIYLHCDNDLDSLLKSINSKLSIMSEVLDGLKAKLDLQDKAIDGLAANLTFIKGKLAGAEGGLTKDEVAELNTIIDARTAKLQDLDAQTDSSDGGTSTPVV